MFQGKDEAVVYFPKDKWLDPEYMAKRGYEWAPMSKFASEEDYLTQSNLTLCPFSRV